MNRYVRTVLLMALALGALLAWLALQRLAAAGPAAAVAGQLSTFTTISLSIFVAAAPFLLLGALASGLVEVFVHQDDLSRYVPRGALRGALAGSLLGFFFPVGECGVVPLARRLFKKGLPLPMGIAFLLAAPALNPIVAASTAAAFGFGRVLAARLIFSLVIATATGLVFGTQTRPERLLRPSALAVAAGAGGLAPEAPARARPTFRQGLGQALAVAADEFFDLGRYLVFGALLAALMQLVIPQPALLTVSSGPVISALALTLLAVVLSVSATVDAFIALAFAGTFTTGSILAFLVSGPMVDIKSALMFLKVFQRRAVLYLVLLPLLMTVLAAVLVNLNTAW